MSRRAKKFSLFIGRYQPLHRGHIRLIRTVLDKGGNACIAIRDTEKSNTDPLDFKDRKRLFKREFGSEMRARRLTVVKIPDIAEVCYGRKVGWGIREIRLDKKTELISAAEIRKNGCFKDLKGLK